MHCTHGRLPELLALITRNVVPWRDSQITVGIVRNARSQQQRRTTHVTCVDLQRHVRTVTDFTCYGNATDIGTEADAVETDIFRMLKEVTSRPKTAIVTWSQRTTDSAKPCLAGI